MNRATILKKSVKAAGLALLIIFSINVAAVITDYLILTNAGERIYDFEYSNFKFYLNGRQTYNQFDRKNLLFNLLITFAVAVLQFRTNNSKKQVV